MCGKDIHRNIGVLSTAGCSWKTLFPDGTVKFQEAYPADIKEKTLIPTSNLSNSTNCTMVCFAQFDRNTSTDNNILKKYGKGKYGKTKYHTAYEKRKRSYVCVRTTFRESLNMLTTSGWYWGAITQDDAKQLLKLCSVGTFLIRDSSDERYLYSLSVRLHQTIINVRVIYNQGEFMFECFDTEERDLPRFDCIVKLVNYYAGVGPHLDQRTICIQTDIGYDAMTLNKPLLNKVPTLQHLARCMVNKTYTQDQQYHFKLSNTVETYMRQYPFPI